MTTMSLTSPNRGWVLEKIEYDSGQLEGIYTDLGKLIDEGNNAEAAREMYESGNWIVPTFNYVLRVDKPALLYWLQMLGYHFFGIWELVFVPFQVTHCAFYFFSKPIQIEDNRIYGNSVGIETIDGFFYLFLSVITKTA